MAKVVVADAGPLIAFAHLELFSLFPSVLGTVLVPDAVLRECLHVPTRPDAVAIQSAIEAGWLQVKDCHDPPYNDLPPSLGDGERAAIGMARELDCPVLINDKLARRVAGSVGLQVIGTGGVLIKAKRAGKITTVASLLDTLQTCGYHLAPDLITRILQLSGEQ